MRFLVAYFILGITMGAFVLAFFLMYHLTKTVEMNSYVVRSLVVGCILALMLNAVLTPFIRFKLLVYQRVAKMIYIGRYYLIDNVAVVSMFNNKHKMRRKVVYYPKLYVIAKRRKIQLEIQLDGSKFHDKFKNLSAELEDMFSGDLHSVYTRNSYMVYDLRLGFKNDRISIEQTAPIGYAIALMKDFMWNVAKSPNALIVGGIGGGKTFFLFTLVINLLKMGAKVSIYDVKRSALSSLSDVIPGVFTEAEHIIKDMKATSEAMIERYKSIRKRSDYQAGKDFTYYKIKPVVLVMDEFVALQQSLDKNQKLEFDKYLRQISLMGREAGYLMILTTQRPDAKFMPADVRDQLSLRVALGSMSDEGYRMAFGSVDKTFLSFEGEKGRGYCFMDGVTTRVRSFYSPHVPSDYDFRSEIAKLTDTAAAAWAHEAPSAKEAVETVDEAMPRTRIREVILEEDK